MNDFYIDKAQQIIKDIQYATLATVSPEGDPYNAPVFFAYDSELNLYWSSSPRAQHSQNIDHNGKVYIVIYDSTIEQGAGWGVYIKTEATAASENETHKALSLLGNRRGREFNNIDSFKASKQRAYKARPQSVWINDAEVDSGEYVGDYRVEVDLDSLRYRLAN